MKMKKRFLSILLSLVMVLGLMPGMGLTAYADNSLVGRIIKQGDSFTLNNEYIEYMPGQTVQGSSEFCLDSFRYNEYYNGWVFYFSPSGSFLVSGSETPEPTGFKIDSGDGKTAATAYKLKLFYASYSVTITPGSNMTKTAESGAASQTGLSGAMTDVVYTANEGYYFPTDYSVTAVNGISVTRNSHTQITVSGTPTADAAITLTAPTAKTDQTAPTGLTATKASSSTAIDGKISGVTAAMEYQKNDASAWTAVGENQTEITGLTSGTYRVRYAETADKNASPAVTVEVGVKAMQTITASDVTATYGDTDKSVSASVTDPAEGKGAISYAVKSGSENYIDVNASTGALTIKAVPPTDGKAYVTVTAAETDDCLLATKDVTVTISKADSTPATVTANNRTYDSTEKPLVTVTGTATGGTMQYALGTDDQTAPTKDWNEVIPSKTDAGTYYVWYKVAGDNNHNGSKPDFVKTTISVDAADQKAVDAVNTRINKLDVNNINEKEVTYARTAYELLTDVQKTLIEQEVLDKLEAAENKLSEANQAAATATQLEAAKASAIDRLNDYSQAKALLVATEAEKKAYDDAVLEGIAAINEAADKDAVATALTNAKKAIDDVLTQIVKDRAEAKALAEAKTSALEAVHSCDPANYSGEDQQTVTAAITAAEGAIEAATAAGDSENPEAGTVAKALADFGAAIKDVKTNLEKAQEKAIAAINAVKKADYIEADQAAVEALQAKMIEKVNKATDIDRVEDVMEVFEKELASCTLTADAEAKALAEAKTAALEAVHSCDPANYSGEDQQTVTAAITAAEGAIEAATAAGDSENPEAGTVAKALADFGVAIKDVKTNLEKAQEKAIAAINEVKKADYIEADQAAVEALQAKMIEKVNKATDIDRVEDVMEVFEKELAGCTLTADAEAAAAAQLAAAKASAIDRLDDYSEAKALADATAAEKAAYKKAIDDGITAITGAADKDKVTAALENAKRAVDAALANIETARADAAKAEAEMNAAEKTLSDANKAAEDAAAAAAAATADEYASDADKQAISDAKTAVDNAIDAAKALPQNATAKQKADAAKAIEDAVKALGDATDTAGINSAAARTAAEEKAGKEAQLEAAKTYAKDRLEDYSEAKALSDFSKAEKKAYKKVVDTGIASINAAADEDTVATALTKAKRAVDKAIEKIKKDRAEAKAKKVKNVTVNVATVSTKSINAAIKKAGGKAKYVKTITLGKNVKKINAKAITKYKKVKTLQVKTTKLKKKTVRNSLRSSGVTTIKVKVSSKKKTNKKYVKKYKKIFTAKNAGKSVKVAA